MNIFFTKEKNSAEYELKGLPDDSIVTIEKNSTERDLVIKGPNGESYGMVRGVSSFFQSSMSIEKKPKKDWVDGQ